jgi:predicted nucleic acid-binding protein
MSEPSPAYLIDTSWAIRHLRGRVAYTERLSALEPSGLAISVITLAELCRRRTGCVRLGRSCPSCR